MVKIAHRGNVNGPNKEKENSVEHIQSALNMGFDVEVDTWVVNDEIYLGHDEPQYKTDILFINKIKNNAWFHCKNLEAMMFFDSIKNINYFWHQNDKFTLTSLGFIWTNTGEKTGTKSILVDINNTIDKNNLKLYGFCSDFLI